MSNIVSHVEETLLSPNEIDLGGLHTVLTDLIGPGVGWGDIYIQSVCDESWSLEDGIVKEGDFNIEQGVGVRAVVDEKTGFAYSNSIALPQMREAAIAARSIAKSGKSGKVAVPKQQTVPALYPMIDPIATMSADDKVALLMAADREARQQDPRIKEVVANFSADFEWILIINSDGLITADMRPLVTFHVQVIAEENGRRESGFAGGGRRLGYEYFQDGERVRYFAREAARQALTSLGAVAAPAGVMPVVLAPGWPGVLLHEAIGHGLEGDFNRKGTSAFTGRLGEHVATPLCTVVDDGTVPNRRGSLTIDDEGTPTEKTVLIENGVLKSYMHDRLNAKLMNARPTGNGRRESFRDIPIPRMTNTYMLPGESDPAEIIASVKKGLYAVNFGGGQVDITSGKFVFSASEAYLIENGKVTTPVRGATLVGNGPDILQQVSMVGNDLQLDDGIGTCGKDGQSVPVGVGQPTLRLDAMTVGGTAV